MVELLETRQLLTVNAAPIGTSSTVSTPENIPLVIQTSNFGFTDPNNTPANHLLAVKIDTIPTGGTFKDNGKTVVAGQLVSAIDIANDGLVYTPKAQAFGLNYANFKFQVEDDGGTANKGVNLDPVPKTMTVNVISTPVVSPIANQIGIDGSKVSLQIHATDPAKYALTYSASGLPSGVTINPQTGAISGTIQSGDASASPYMVTITASNPIGGMGTTRFSWAVTARNPVITTIVNQSGVEGTLTSLQVVATDPGSYALNYSATGLPAGVTINAQTGLISGRIFTGNVLHTPFSVHVTASNSFGGTVTSTFTWTITAGNPFIPLGKQTSVEGTQVSVLVGATDPGNYALKYAASGLPTGLTINPTTGLISGTVALGDATHSPYAVQITASDAYGGTKTSTITWTVNAQSPSLAKIANQVSFDGSVVSLQVHGTDPRNYTLTYSANGLPAGLTINQNTGLISGTISSGDAAFSPYKVYIATSNPYGAFTVTAFTWAVNAQNPVIASINNQTGVDGSQVSLPVAAYDPASYPLTYSASGLPAGLSIDPNLGLISGTIFPSDATSSPYTVFVTVTNPYGGSTTTSFIWTLTVQNPIVNSIGNQTSADGSHATLQVMATDPGSYPLTYSASGLPSGLSIIPQTGLISGTVAFGDSITGSYNVQVTITNPYGGIASTSFHWTITAVKPVITAISNQTSPEDSQVALGVHASDPEGFTLSYSASGLPPGLTINSQTGVIAGIISSGDAVTSPYAVQVTASDSHGGVSTLNFTWTVIAQNPVITPISNQTGTDGSGASLPVVASDPAGYALTYSASGLPAGLTINAKTGIISGTISIGDAGQSPYAVHVTASDAFGGTSTATFTWTVAAQKPIINAVGSQAGVEGSVGSLQIHATDPANYALTYSASGLPPGLTINTSTGLIGGTISLGDAVTGSYSVSVTASNLFGGIATTTFAWTVTAKNPVINSIGNQSGIEGASVLLQVPASDPGSYTLTYSASGLPTGLTINTQTGLISGMISSGDAVNSPYTVHLTVSNPYGGSSTSTFAWAVSATNPVIAPITTQSGVDGSTASLQVQASDPSGYTLTYSASGLPTGLTINPQTGLVGGTIALGDAAHGSYAVQITASDPFGGSYSTNFTWIVTAKNPVITSISSQSNTEGSIVSLQVQASDPASYALTYFASGLPGGLSINAQTGLISGTLISGDAANGPYSVQVSAFNSFGGGTLTNFAWTVSSKNPVITTISNQTGVDGSSASLQVQASDPGSYTLTYSASGLPAGLAINSQTGLISGTISLGDSVNSPYAAHVTVSDQFGGSSTANFTWTVTAKNPVITAIGNQSNVEHSTPSLQVQATDPEGYTLAYSATGLPTGLTVNPQTGLISGTVALGDAIVGSYSVVVTVSDPHGGTSVDSFTWTITAQNPNLTPTNQTSVQGSQVSLQIPATDPAGYALTYSASGLPAGLSINTQTGLITGTITIGDAITNLGTYTVQVTASNAHGGSSLSSFVWTINAQNPIVTPTDQTGVEGSSVSVAISATDPQNYTLAYSATGLPPGLAINPQTGFITGTISLGDAASSQYSVQVMVSNSFGGSASASFHWTVTAQNPSLTAIGNQLNVDGGIVSLSTQATDPANYTLTYSATGLPAGLAINAQTGLISGTISLGDAANSTYGVQVTASNAYGGSSTTNFSWAITAKNPLIIAINPQTTVEGSTITPLHVSATDPANYALTYQATGLPAGLSINPQTGVISGKVMLGDVIGSPYLAQITVSDSFGGSTTANVQWTVTAQSPTIKPITNQSNIDGDTISLQAAAVDPRNYTLTYSATGLPSGLAINSSTGAITGTITLGDAAVSPYMVAVTASNVFGGSATTNFTWTIGGLNPNITASIPTQSNVEGSAISTVQVAATDPAGYALTYSSNGLPAGLTINAQTGALTGTPTAGDAASSPYAVQVIVTNAYGGSVTTNFTWNIIAQNPNISVIGNQTSAEGSTIAGLSVIGNDPAGYALKYSATGLPAGLTINAITGVISGTVSYGDTLNAINNKGLYNVQITASNAYGGTSAPSIFTWTTTPASPTISSNNGQKTIVPLSNVEGSVVSSQVLANDPAGYRLTFSATGLPAGLVISPNSGVISGTITIGDATSSPYNVQITASNFSGTALQQNTTASFVWTIKGQAPHIAKISNHSSVENSAGSATVNAVDPNGYALTYSATGLPPGLSINSSTGVISGTVSYGDAALVSGGFGVTVTVSNAYGGSSTSGFLWAVSAQGPALSAIGAFAPTATQTNVELTPITEQVMATDPNGYHLTYFASGLPSGLTIDTQTGKISGTIAKGAQNSSPYTVQVIVSNGYGGSATANFTWIVTTPVAVSNQSNIDGDVVAFTFPATDPDNYPMTIVATGLPAGITMTPGVGVVHITGAITSGDAASSPYTVTITASDAFNGSFPSTFTWTVIAKNPTITKINGGNVTTITNVNGSPGIGTSATQTNSEGDLISEPVLATDPKYTLTYSAINLPAGLTISPSTGQITGTISAGDSTSSPYSVTVVASNPYGGSYLASFTWNISAATNPIVTKIGNNAVANHLTANQTSNELASISEQVLATDPKNHPLTYAATNLPPGLSINPATGLVSGTVTVGDAATSPYFVTVTVSNAFGGSYSFTFTWTITANAPIITQGNLTNVEGTTIAPTQMLATDPGNYALTYSATGLPTGLTCAPNGLVTGTLPIGDAVTHIYNVTLTVTNAINVTSIQNFVWTINAQNPTITPIAAQQTVEQVAVAIQAFANDPANYAITFSSTNLPGGLSINAAGLISGTVSLGDAALSPYNVTITAKDAHGGTISTNFIWTIIAQNPVIAPIVTQSNPSGVPVAFQVNATDPAGYTLSYTLTGQPTGLSISNTGSISGIPTVKGTYTVKVTVSNAYGGSSSLTFTWTIF